MKKTICFLLLCTASFSLGFEYKYNLGEHDQKNGEYTGDVEGSYHIILPDGTIETVKYTTKDGFKVFLLKPITLSIKTPIGHTINIKTNYDSTIDAVKASIESTEGIPSHLQKLMSDGIELEDGNSLDDYKINDNSNIVLSVKRTVLGGDWEIIVKEFDPKTKTTNGKKYTVDVNSSYTVDQLKKKIQEKSGVSPHNMQLEFNGRTLSDGDKTLFEYQLYRQAVVVLINLKKLF